MQRKVNLAIALTHVPGAHPHRDRLTHYWRSTFPGVRLVSDLRRQGVWPTTRLAWFRAILDAPEATHVIVVQDDFYAPSTFLDNVEEALEARPEHVVQLFTHARRQAEAHDRGDAWLTSSDLVWGGSTILPAGWVSEFLSDTGDRFPDDYPSCDVPLGWWVRRQGFTVWHTVPSLMEHVEPGTSLLGHANRTRVAAVPFDAPRRPFSEVPTKPLHIGRSRTRGVD